MASTERRDPLPVYCFKVELSNLKHFSGCEMYFKSVSGLTYESEVQDYPEGGDNLASRRLVGRAKWPNLVLSMGFTHGSHKDPLLKWRREWLDEGPAAKMVRANGKITQLSSDLKPVCHWEFVRGWPCKWVGPEYDASKNELAIVKLEIAHEGLKFGG
jgi:phage tail-like protein